MAPRIESYEFGQIVIDRVTYDADLLILPDGVRPGWWRQEGHALTPADLEDVEKARPRPQMLVIGTGAYDRLHMSGETRAWLRDLRLEWVELPTEEACQRYNELAKAGQRVAAALHLTC